MARTKRSTTKTRDFLQELILWRNDPSNAEEIKKLAHSGNPDAQYALGLIYAEGRGLKQDEIKSCYWLIHAKQQGDQDAETLLQIVTQSMSLDEIKYADALFNSQSLHREISDA